MVSVSMTKPVTTSESSTVNSMVRIHTSPLPSRQLLTSPHVWMGDEQRSKPSRTTSGFARSSSDPSEPAWASGKPWRSLASLSMIRILMYVFSDLYIAFSLPIHRPPFLITPTFDFPCGHHLCTLRHFFLPSLPKTPLSHQRTCSLTLLSGVLIPAPTLTLPLLLPSGSGS